MTRKPLDDEDTPSLLPPLGERDDEDDDTTAQLTHAPRGRDAFGGQMRTAMHALKAAMFSGTTPEEREAAKRAHAALQAEFTELGLSLYG